MITGDRVGESHPSLQIVIFEPALAVRNLLCACAPRADSSPGS